MSGQLVLAARVSRAPIGALMAVGVFWGAFSALVPAIKASVGANDAEFGTALVFTALGAMTAMYLAPRFGRIFGRATLPLAGAFLLAAFFYPLLPGTVMGLGVAFFFMGASVALLDVSANVRISALEARHKLHLMNFNHAMFSFAFAGAAFAASLARKAGAEAEQILPALAAGSVLLWLFLFERGNIQASSEEAEPVSANGTPWAAILLTAVVLFAAFIGESSAEAWSALHIERTLGAPPGEGGFGPAMLGLMMGIGRMLGQFVAARLGEARLIFWSAVLGFAGAVLIGAALTPRMALAGVAVIALGVAIVVPSVNSILGRLVTARQRPHAISRAWLFGMLGFFAGPAIMGLIAEAFGLRVSFFAVALIVAVMAPAVVALAKLERPAP